MLIVMDYVRKEVTKYWQRVLGKNVEHSLNNTSCIMAVVHDNLLLTNISIAYLYGHACKHLYMF